MYQFFVNPGQIQGHLVTIEGTDVNHIKNVLRMKPGEEIAVSNGQDGREYRCEIEKLEEEQIICRLLFIKEEYRGKGFAKQAITSWENEMKNQGYKMTLVSTQVDEGAQHLYRKLGYIDCGGLVLNNTPFDQPMEMFFRKVL